MTASAGHCPICGLESRQNARFCVGCGESLPRICSTCGQELPTEAVFCDACGRAVGEVETSDAPETVTTPDAEWRQLTVMFCDLARSTQLVAKLGAEAWREVVRAFQESCAEVIEGFGGHIAQYLGDGLLVYFSYPQAHEDDAERAVRAGLAILEAGEEELNPELKREHGVELAMRIGIHTGPVVVGEIGGGERRETLAVGQTANIAARLQGVAEPGSLVVSAATLRLVPGLFLTRELGPQRLKGVAELVPTYRVVQATGIRSRLDIARAAGLTPLVGRQQEIGLLLDRWEQVQDGMGQAVLVCGEAGIGKSRLMLALRDRLAATPHSWLECRGTPYTQDSALYPVVELQQQTRGFRAEDSPEEKLVKLAHGLEGAGFPLRETLPLFAALHSLPLPEGYEEPNWTPQAKKRKTLETLVEWLLRLGRQQPVLLLVEDLHWIDPSTLELLGLLLEQLPTAPVLVILTYRPVFQPSWPAHTHVMTLQLNRLTRVQSAQMVGAIAGGHLPNASVREIVHKTDGVPLFLEEFTKALLQSPAGEDARSQEGIARAVPEKLQDLLMARLDRLGPVKEVAQLGATLGREFTYPLLRALWPHGEEKLREGLFRLVEAEFLYQRGFPPQATYLFKHALIQDEAYQSQLLATRQRVHRRIGEVLERYFPQIVETQPELVAHHYSEAGLPEPAIRYWGRAGERAVERSANLEATRYLDKGLRLLETLPETTERKQQELSLRGLLSIALFATRGYSAVELERNLVRLQELCPPDSPQLIRVLWLLSALYTIRGDRKAPKTAQRFLRLAQRADDPTLRLVAAIPMLMVSFHLGQHLRARDYFERAARLYDIERHGTLWQVYGQDPGVTTHVYAAWNLWFLGYPDRAWKTAEKAVLMAEAVSHPLDIAISLGIAGDVRQLRREPKGCRELAKRAVAVSSEQGFRHWLGRGMMLRGWALAQEGDPEAGIEQFQEGFSRWRGTGAGVLVPLELTFLAEICLEQGKPQQGLAHIEEALSISKTSLGRHYEPEQYRLRGELLLLNQRDSAAAEVCFQKALEVARNHSAKSLELRAAMSLARLCKSQGKQKQARELLAPIYDWFTEGFDTQDLKDAKALLEQLS